MPFLLKLEVQSLSVQVLGLTAYSQWQGATELRQCLPGSPEARTILQDLALERLENFVHVGVSERLEESISSLAAALEIDIEASSWAVSSSTFVWQSSMLFMIQLVISNTFEISRAQF